MSHASDLRLSPEVALPLASGTSTLAILGIRGSGKTNTAGVITEQVLDHGQQVVVIDPLDVWWGLKSSADGQAEGYPVVVFGGEHADLFLFEQDAKRLAHVVAEQRVSVVLSIRHLRKGAQRRFVAEFCEELYQVKGRPQLKTPLLVVIDEASSFVPQQTTGDVARSVGAIEDLVRRGRSSGLGVVLIDQRAASVNKNVLTQLEVLIAHRHTSPQDRKALDEWIKANASEDERDQFLTTLARLTKGQAWVWSPTFEIFARTQINLRSTFDSSKTPTGGAPTAEPGILARPDLSALQELLAGDEDEAAAGAETTGHTKSEPCADCAAKDRRIAELQQALDSMNGHLESVLGAIEEVISRPAPSGAYQVTGGLTNGWMCRDGDAQAVPALRVKPEAKQTSEPRMVQTSPSGELSGPQVKILTAVASFESLGIQSPSKGIVAALAGYSPSSGTFGTYLSQLRSGGLIEYRNGGIERTDAGRAAVPAPETPPSLAELRARWAHIIKNSTQVALMQALPARAAVTREDLAEAVQLSPSSGTYGTYLSKLRSLGLIDYPSRGLVQATELWSPEGLL